MFLDISEVKETGGFKPIPEGTYVVISDEAEVKKTKSGTGEYISMKFKILQGTQEGRTLFHSFNIQNENPKAVEIGLGQLKTFMKCAGFTEYKLENVAELVGYKVEAVVKIKSDEGYGEKAVISYFKALPKDQTSGVTPF